MITLFLIISKIFNETIRYIKNIAFNATSPSIFSPFITIILHFFHNLINPHDIRIYIYSISSQSSFFFPLLPREITRSGLNALQMRLKHLRATRVTQRERDVTCNASRVK